MKRKRLLLAVALVTGMLGWNSVQAQEAGTYYLQNVGTGKWLGPGNSWGTQASVLNHADYWKLAKISDGVFTLESVVSNGGTSYYLTGTYCDGGATNFTFTDLGDNVYSIANGSGGYLTTNGTTVDVSASDGSSVNSQWKLWSEADMAAGMDAATVENPFDATYLIKDHDLGRNNRDYSAWSNTNATAPKTSDKKESGSSRYSIEAYHVTFDVNQTISGVPNGVYAVKVNGFYRKDADGAFPVLYANDRQTTLPERTGSENSMQDAAVSFEAGNYLSNPVYVQVTDGELKVGVKTEGTGCWVIFKNFHLSYYGDVSLAEVLLSEYVKTYNEALAAAQAYQTVDMFDADKTALNNAITANTIDLDNTTQEELTSATANLNAAATAAEKAQTKYAAYQNIVTAVNGQTNVDITSYIANLGFEEGNLNAWTTDNGGNVATNDNFSGKVGTYFVERWQQNTALGSGSLTHDVITLPAGVYTIKVNAQNIEQYNNSAAGTGYFFCVNDAQQEIGAAGTYTVAVKYTEPTEVTLKFLLDGCTGNWISCDNVTINYDGEDFPEVALVEGKMNAEVAAAQTAAKTAYDADASVDNYNALVAAVAAAQASVNAYQKLGQAIAKIDAALAAATSATESDAAAYQTIKTAYNNGSIADADIPANVISAYEAVIPVIKSQTAASADFTLAIQNQSFEYGDMTGWTTAGTSDDTGVRETANATYAATGADGSYLFNTWWKGVPLTQAVSGIPTGEYTLTASVASDGATIYLLGNGEHNDGIETGGSYPSKEVMQETTFTFLVKDGTATIGVVGGADGTAGEHKDYVEAGYWWYKADNFRLVKNRDLTEEEMAVIPTAIALYNGETEVTEAIELTATANTVTLTPVFTPEDATETVTWTSSDETVATVADGVVTGIASGTATITVTSTLDETVSATATVNVSYPESTVPETVEIIDEEAMTKTIYTLSPTNLIKNGTFEYANAVSQWKTIGYTTDAVASNFTITANGGVNDGAYITTNGGGVGNEKTIRQSVAVESGKTYYFSVWTSGKAPSADNFKYNALFKMSDATTETGTLKEFEWPQGAGKTSNEWSHTEHVFTAETGYVGVRMGWNESSNFDEFVLAEVISQEVIDLSATAEDYAALNEAIENVPTLGFLAEEAAPYNNVEAAAALAAAQSIDQSVKNSAATVQEATTALNNVTWNTNTEEVNAVYDGTFAGAANNGAPAGWTMSNNTLGGDYHSRAFVGDERLAEFNSTNSGLFIRFDGTNSDAGSMYYYGQTAGYTMPLKANTTYYVSADLAGWGSTGNNVRINVGGPEGFTGVGETNNMAVRADNANNEPIHVKFFFTTGDAGNYTISLQNPGASAKHNAVISNVEIMRAPEVTVDGTLAAGKFATRIFPFVPEKTTDVSFYSCAAVGDNGKTLTLSEEETLKANTPYILWNSTDAEINITQTGVDTHKDDTYTEGWLTGVFAEGLFAPVGSYVLQTHGEKQSFYSVKADNIDLTPYRAYLTVPADVATGVKAFNLGVDDATAINALDALTSGAYEGIYTVDGMKLNRIEKGVNILKMADGTTRKVVVK